MKTTSSHRFLALGAGASLLLASASNSSAQLIAYEGFAGNEFDFGGTIVTVPADGTALSNVGVTGFGFESFTATGSNSSPDSHYSYNGGFSYPADAGSSLPGTETAGGVIVVQGQDNAKAYYRLNFTDANNSTLNDTLDNTIYVSYLTARLGAEPFERPAGVRFPNNIDPNNNGSWGTIGTGKTGDGEYTIAAWNFNDTHGLSSGYAPTYGEVDFIVAELDQATNTISFWVNPMSDGTSEGFASFVWTDGDKIPAMNLYGIGFEAVRGEGWYLGDDGVWHPSDDRPFAIGAFDEIRVGLDFASVAGFEMVPEPSVIGFLGFGLIATLLGLRRRR